MSSDAAAGGSFEQAVVGSLISGKYRVDRLIGEGGMGAVFQATNVAIGKRVALKFLNRDAARDRDAAERFQREALAASVVESSHIVQIFDSGTSEQGLPFLVMELLTGEDLRARIKREQRLSCAVAVNVTSQVLRGLVRAHAAGIVHRDLKPENVFLCERDDEALYVKIVDFGVSKLGRGANVDTLTGRGTVVGTAHYMSPEQAQAYADLDGRTDLFSVGAMLYECLAGQPPYVAPTYEAVLIAICTRDPRDLRTLRPDVSRPLADVVHRALARDRSQRFASAEAMLQALNDAAPELAPRQGESLSVSRHAPVAATPELGDGTSGTARASARASRFRTLAIAAVALLYGVGVAAPFLRARSPNDRAEQRASVVATPPVLTNVASSESTSAASERRKPNTPSPPAVASEQPVSTSSSRAHAASTRSNVPALRTRPAAHDARPAPKVEAPKGVAQELTLSTREP